MINDQIIWWIIKNKVVYVKNSIKEYILQNEGPDFDEGFKRILKKLMVQLGKNISQNLAQQKSVLLPNFVLFFPIVKPKIVNEKSIARIGASYQIHGTLKTKILIKTKSKQEVSSPINTNIAFQIASLLLLDFSIIEEMIQIIIKAINDLVGNGKTILLDLLFCKMQISNKEVKCRFYKQFMESLQQRQQDKKQNVKLCLCFGKHGQNSQLKSIDEIQQSTNNKKWQQIKDGNLFDYPSLVEIKNHFDKGKILQMKYSQLYS